MNCSEHVYLTIRPAREEDAPRLLEIYRPYVEHTAITFEYDTPTLEEFTSRIRQVKQKFPYLVAETADGIIGYAYAHPFHERAAYGWSAETSIYIDQTLCRSGIGGLLYRVLEELIASQNVLNLNACVAVPEADDPYLTDNSFNFHRHVGYQVVGTFHKCGYKFDRWYNMVWLEKLIGTHESGQAAVIPFPEIEAKTGLPYLYDSSLKRL